MLPELCSSRSTHTCGCSSSKAIPGLAWVEHFSISRWEGRKMVCVAERGPGSLTSSGPGGVPGKRPRSGKSPTSEASFVHPPWGSNRPSLPPREGWTWQGWGLGGSCPAEGARPGLEHHLGDGTQRGAVRLQGHLGRKPQLCIPLLWPQLLSRWEAENRHKGKEERETGPGVHTQTCTHTRALGAWGLAALLGRPP